MKRVSGLVAVSVLALVACTGPDSGQVLEKIETPELIRYEPGTLEPGPCYSYRKNGLCRVRGKQVWKPGRKKVRPASWSLYLVDGESRGWHEVPHDVWVGCKKGQTYRNGVCR